MGCQSRKSLYNTETHTDLGSLWAGSTLSAIQRTSEYFQELCQSRFWPQSISRCLWIRGSNCLRAGSSSLSLSTLSSKLDVDEYRTVGSTSGISSLVNWSSAFAAMKEPCSQSNGVLANQFSQGLFLQLVTSSCFWSLFFFHRDSYIQ